MLYTASPDSRPATDFTSAPSGTNPAASLNACHSPCNLKNSVDRAKPW